MRLRNGYRIHQAQRRFEIMNLRRGQVESQGNAATIRHQMDRAALPFAPALYERPPLFAGTKDPSRNACAQFSLPCASSVDNRLNQIRSQVPSSCQRTSQRWAVESSPSSLGKSHQRQPTRITYKIASIVCRSWRRLRPRLGCGGKRGSTITHCASVKLVE